MSHAPEPHFRSPVRLLSPHLYPPCLSVVPQNVKAVSTLGVTAPCPHHIGGCLRPWDLRSKCTQVIYFCRPCLTLLGRSRSVIYFYYFFSERRQPRTSALKLFPLVCCFSSKKQWERPGQTSFFLFFTFYEAVGAHHLGAALDNHSEENKRREREKEGSVGVCWKVFDISHHCVLLVALVYRPAPPE